jgi:glutathione S-transferase
VESVFFPKGKATKHKIAQMLAERSPDELASKLPPKRREWNSEFRQMDVFDAMALAEAFRRRKDKEQRKTP